MKIGLAGAGLIGGSLALALRGAHDLRVYDADAATREAARRAGLDTVDTLAAVLPADAVVVATPLTDVVATLAALVDRADGAVLVDVASLRAPVNAYAERAPSRARIVGAHPMAGSTASGFAAADAELFRDRPFLVVPTARSDDRAMAVAGDIARAAGGRVTVLSASVHDAAMGRLSALPLAVAAATTHVAAEGDLAPAGPGFRDTTRLAATPVDLAVELLLGNADAAAAEITKVVRELDRVAAALRDGDRVFLREYLRAARDVRRSLDERP